MSDELEERLLIFLFKTGNKLWAYLLLDKNCANDGRHSEGKIVHYPIKLGSGNSGSIFKIKTNNNGEDISYPKINIPIGFWKNSIEVAEWQTRHRGYEDNEKAKQAAQIDIIPKVLEPIREAYLQCSDRQQRSIIIARVIDYITYGKR